MEKRVGTRSVEKRRGAEEGGDGVRKRIVNSPTYEELGVFEGDGSIKSTRVRRTSASDSVGETVEGETSESTMCCLRVRTRIRRYVYLRMRRHVGLIEGGHVDFHSFVFTMSRVCVLSGA